MKKSIEIELKFEILDPSQIEHFLESLKFVLKKRIVDVYLDTPDANLFKQGIFIRIRNNKKLDFKFNPKHFGGHGSYCLHDHCQELSFALPLKTDAVAAANRICSVLGLKKIIDPNLAGLKQANHLIESVVIDKLRRSYQDSKFSYDLDDVKNLGLFLEIESLVSTDENIEKIKKEMITRLKNLKIKHLNVGYNEIYWRKHNFNLYLQGLYLLEEDYQKYRQGK
ncbi:MAG TPA: CYTH domain-containing protein [Candidatus Bathyarchaeia archaeon]|nr:CYTH domain-containing protein [Candidatus Bathyarchaeia archaeon]